ncbi:hypothetical protein BDN72DRAFT_455102 [Pluteus cervinus]|uniref:Uncharacterized protein n=1 Tax=Pluteus cervinus TaxID=181527 RepID=A0ACD3BCS9_9AGAR|nr:hypothetical protein BDN72DRAFT_455102 [Pluteus cervinus]
MVVPGTPESQASLSSFAIISPPPDKKKQQQQTNFAQYLYPSITGAETKPGLAGAPHTHFGLDDSGVDFSHLQDPVNVFTYYGQTETQPYPPVYPSSPKMYKVPPHGTPRPQYTWAPSDTTSSEDGNSSGAFPEIRSPYPAVVGGYDYRYVPQQPPTGPDSVFVFSRQGPHRGSPHTQSASSFSSQQTPRTDEYVSMPQPSGPPSAPQSQRSRRSNASQRPSLARAFPTPHIPPVDALAMPTPQLPPPPESNVPQTPHAIPGSPTENERLLPRPHLFANTETFNFNPEMPYLGAATPSSLALPEQVPQFPEPNVTPDSGKKNKRRFVGGFVGGIRKVFGGASGKKTGERPQSGPNQSTLGPDPSQTSTIVPPEDRVMMPEPEIQQPPTTLSAPTGQPTTQSGGSRIEVEPSVVTPTSILNAPQPTGSIRSRRSQSRAHSQHSQLRPGEYPPSLHSVVMPIPGAARTPTPSVRNQRVPAAVAVPVPAPQDIPATADGFLAPPVEEADLKGPVLARLRRSTDYAKMEGVPDSTPSTASARLAPSSGPSAGDPPPRTDAATGSGSVDGTIRHTHPAGEVRHRRSRSSHRRKEGQYVIEVNEPIPDFPGGELWVRFKRWWRWVDSLPWVADERVTVDYIPGFEKKNKIRIWKQERLDRSRSEIDDDETITATIKSSGRWTRRRPATGTSFTNPSWYGSRARWKASRKELDLLSSGSASGASPNSEFGFGRHWNGQPQGTWIPYPYYAAPAPVFPVASAVPAPEAQPAPQQEAIDESQLEPDRTRSVKENKRRSHRRRPRANGDANPHHSSWPAGNTSAPTTLAPAFNGQEGHIFFPFPVTIETTPEGTQIIKDETTGANRQWPRSDTLWKRFERW